MVGGLRGAAVLVVDDDDAHRDVIGRIVDQEGGTVRNATDEREVIRVLTTWRPDVILLDISLPGMDGYALLAVIREEPALRGIPAVAVTGRSSASDKQRAKEAGFAKHVTKPFGISDLVSVIAELVTPRTAAAV